MNQALEELAGRVRDYLSLKTPTVEKKMFGGICFMARGNMVAGVMKEGTLLARVGKDGMAAALLRPGCHEMDMQGRKMSGFVIVDGDVLEDDENLAEWLDISYAFASALPAK
ncbi:TfoX/Sxy family protein [Pelagibacterium lentulum]|uniref:RNA methyltransferase n=1 Tax=Pelagibacterium lentulum TaxID=2029865 RepID=A0A916RDU8_9HYPH|nr:TfoX/Sxy family protein [Pelagibacterium lentulum]GGA47914.1 RNA methyltransferase [Pelagibacterium lentulum]